MSDTLPASRPRVRRGVLHYKHLPVGTLRIHKHEGSRRAVMKVSDVGLKSRRWRNLGIVVWESSRGPLPHGYCLWHIDRNPLNCALDNLEAITLAERIHRNAIASPEATNAARVRTASRLAAKGYWRLAAAARRIQGIRRRREAALG